MESIYILCWVDSLQYFLSIDMLRQRQLDQELAKLYPDPKIKAKRAVIRKGRENYACLLNIELRISGGMSGNEATLRREVRLNANRDAADWYDGVLNDQDNQEIFSGPISLYKY